jgi:hypothetical protein
MFVKFEGGIVVTAVAILSKLYVIYTNVNVVYMPPRSSLAIRLAFEIAEFCVTKTTSPTSISDAVSVFSYTSLVITLCLKRSLWY